MDGLRVTVRLVVNDSRKRHFYSADTAVTVAILYMPRKAQTPLIRFVVDLLWICESTGSG